jgi:hypothetical protein
LRVPVGINVLPFEGRVKDNGCSVDWSGVGEVVVFVDFIPARIEHGKKEWIIGVLFRRKDYVEQLRGTRPLFWME